MRSFARRSLACHGLLVVSLVFLGACSSGDDGSGGSGSPTGPSNPGGGGGGGSGGGSTFSAVIGGQQWTATIATANNNTQVGGFSVAGSDASGMLTFGFAIPNSGLGVYDINSPSNANYANLGNGQAWWATTNGGGSGTITVTSWTTTTAAGTFSFTLVPSPGTGSVGNVAVAQGMFNVTYTTTAADGKR
jgi:hypothetical protein